MTGLQMAEKPTSTVSDAINEVNERVPEIPAITKNIIYNRACAAVNAYPTDCPAKQVLREAFSRSTRDSVVAFLAVTGWLNALETPLLLSVPRLLKNDHGAPVFFPSATA